MINVFIEEEVIPGDKVLIPDGYIAKLRISTDGSKSMSGKQSMMWKLDCVDSQYADAPIDAEFVHLSGYQEIAHQIGKTAMMYALETNRKAHETKNYEIQNSKEFDGMYIYAKIKIIVSEWRDQKTGQEKQSLKNKVQHFISPRPSSKTYKYYEAVLRGEQNWLTGNMPELKGNASASNSSNAPQSAPIDDDIPFTWVLPLIMSFGAAFGIA